ncbi:hypothetical protein ABK040_007338 [Willaertia magna]
MVDSALFTICFEGLTNGAELPLYAPVLAADGKNFSNACVARRSKALYPYISVSVQNSVTNPVFPTDVSNASIALTKHYLCADLCIIRFLLS